MKRALPPAAPFLFVGAVLQSISLFHGNSEML